MAHNDVVLVDSLLAKSASRFGDKLEPGERFELFAFEQILKDADLSTEELREGWVDGGDDGGIDGFYILIDGQLVSEEPDPANYRRSPHIEVVVITCKHKASFQQVPLNNLISSASELFDLQLTTDDLKYPFEEALLGLRELFRATYVALATRNPQLTIRFAYASRGETAGINPNVTARAEQLKSTLAPLFSNCTITFAFLGAGELLALARQERTYSLRLPFIESTISRAHTNYVVLCRLTDYAAFVSDDVGNLRRYLFEGNVRDYVGNGSVNRDIAATLSERLTAAEVDFWWLNNGITLLATAATIAGKEISLDNVQIVNGLQTTETIFRYFKDSGPHEDDRAVLVKIIITSEDDVRDRIVKATNYQNSVELASLRSTDPIQRNIEHYLGDHDWYYDRRKNFYRNIGKPDDRIVSVSYLGSAMRALVLKQPDSALRERTKWMREDAAYRRVFNEDCPLAVYLACIHVMKWTEEQIRTSKVNASGGVSRKRLRQWRYLLALLVAQETLGSKEFKPAELATLVGKELSATAFSAALTRILAAEDQYSRETGRKMKWGRPDPKFISLAMHSVSAGARPSVPAVQPHTPRAIEPARSTAPLKEAMEDTLPKDGGKPWWKVW